MTVPAKLALVPIIAALCLVSWYLHIRGLKKPTAVAYDPEAIAKTKQNADEAQIVAVQIEAKAAVVRRHTRAVMAVADEAVEARVAAGIMWADLPQEAAKENDALASLVSVLVIQTEVEKQRGDAWMAAAIASQEAADAARSQLEAVGKAERRRGFKWGIGLGAGAVILAVVLL